MVIRGETPQDSASIRSVTDAAFDGVEHSGGTEGAIIEALREVGALTLSLVAEQNDVVVGHVAFSPVLIDGEDRHWFGLGPVSVSPGLQRSGIGTALIKEGLQLLKQRGAHGCVVLGDPDFYRRFGFTSGHALHYGNVPPEYFQSMVLSGFPEKGVVAYHEGFDAR